MLSLREMHGVLAAGFATFDLAPRLAERTRKASDLASRVREEARTFADYMGPGIVCTPRRCDKRCGPTVTKLSVAQLTELNKLAANARATCDPDAERDPACARPHCTGRMRRTGEPTALLMNPRFVPWEES